MAYNGSMGVPNQFQSAASMATDLGVNSHDQDATVGSPNPATNPGVGASYMNALGNNGPRGVLDLARNQAIQSGIQAIANSSAGQAVGGALKSGASAVGGAIKSGIGDLIGAL